MNTLHGKVMDGKGAAQQFMAKPHYLQKINDAAGFVPFLGTLNLRVNPTEWEKIKKKSTKKTVEGFVENGKTSGGFDLYPARLPNGEKGAVIVPHRTTHASDVIEIIAPYSLRQKFGLKSGSAFSITIEE